MKQILIPNFRKCTILPGCILTMFVLASCSQKVAETNEVVADTVSHVESDSIAQTIEAPRVLEKAEFDSAEKDSFVAENVIVKDSLNDDGIGVLYRRLKFLIGSPLEDYGFRFNSVDSLTCAYNKWDFSPKAVYIVNIKEIYDEGCSGEDVTMYRNDIKVMEYSDYECGDSDQHSETYYYSDGSVAETEVRETRDGQVVY